MPRVLSARNSLVPTRNISRENFWTSKYVLANTVRYGSRCANYLQRTTSRNHSSRIYFRYFLHVVFHPRRRKIIFSAFGTFETNVFVALKKIPTRGTKLKIARLVFPPCWGVRPLSGDKFFARNVSCECCSVRRGLVKLFTQSLSVTNTFSKIIFW